MGGEPLLVKNFTKYVEIVRNYFPAAEIVIVSNGLLIEKLSEEQLGALRKYNAGFYVSQYPPTREIADKIIEKLYEAEIRLFLSEPITSFMERQNYDYGMIDKHKEDWMFAWENCPAKVCHTLKEGRLMMCGSVYSLSHLGNYLDEVGYKENSIDLKDNNLSGWDALLKLEKPIEFCSRCYETLNKTYVAWECDR